MNQQTTFNATLAPTAPTAPLAERNRVLRNTYWLLALSMVPTVLGAWVGVSTGLASALSPGIGLVVFLVGAFGFMFAIEKTKNSAAGVPMLLAFTFFMGLMLSRIIDSVLGLANGAGRCEGAPDAAARPTRSRRAAAAANPRPGVRRRRA
jgi:modulator of FtsH protease